MKRFHLAYTLKRRLIIGISLIVLSLLYIFNNTSYLVRALSAVLFFVIFYVADHLFYLKFRKRHYFFAFFIAVSGFLLSPLYFISPSYDKALHLVQPMMFAAMTHHLVSRLNLNRKWRFIFVFAVVVAGIGLFEVAEYTLDQTFDLKLQGVYLRDSSGLEKLTVLQNPIDDTMVDMSIGVAGAIIYVFAAWFFGKGRKREFR